jgi:hypothetical protein
MTTQSTKVRDVNGRDHEIVAGYINQGSRDAAGDAQRGVLIHFLASQRRLVSNAERFEPGW